MKKFLVIAVVAVMSTVTFMPILESRLPTPLATTMAAAETSEAHVLGKQLYDRQCAACHGVDGRGNGEAAYLLYPKPRDFVAARYRLISTWGGIPTDADLFQAITRGMPGSAMPSWAHLPEEQRWALVHYIKSFAKNPITVKPIKMPDSEGYGGTGKIVVPPEPAYTAEARARAEELYADACASCHGATGKGDGVQEQTDEEGFPTRPRDLTAGVFKGNPDPEHLYQRIIAGSPGTPMPMSDWAYGNDAWHLVHFVRSLSSDEQRKRMEMKKFTIIASRVSEIPNHPDSETWRQASPVNLNLMPLWWRQERPEELTVRAVYDGEELALLLVWQDATDDQTAMRPQDFRDAAAVQFALNQDPPFFAMGERNASVNIWMWKSERQADLEPAFQDLEKVYPNLGIDSYPNLTRSSLEQPHRQALTLQSDPTFVTGWGAGNIVSDPLRNSAAEDLSAEGFGTLRSRPQADQTVHARGVYAFGSYRIILRRSLGSNGDGAVWFRPGTSVPVAFAVWNGSAGDRAGQKLVTIWQDLKLAN